MKKDIKTFTPLEPQCELTRRGLLALPLALSIAGSALAAGLPRPAAELKIPRPGGQPPIDLASYKGKVVAMMFLLTTCPHCKAFAGTLEKVSQELGTGFQPIGAAIDDPTGRKVTDFGRETGAKFPIGFVKQELANQFLEFPSMKSMYMPQLALIDRAGMVRYHHPGEDPFYNDQEANLRKEVKLLLAEKAAGGGAPAAGAKPAPAKGKAGKS
jgi:thiol-disulfide isomerase/thioredoxin